MSTQLQISPFNVTANNLIREMVKGGLSYFGSVITHSKDVPYQIDLGPEDHVKTDSLFFHAEGKACMIVVELTHRKIARMYGDEVLLSLQIKVFGQTTMSNPTSVFKLWNTNFAHVEGWQFGCAAEEHGKLYMRLETQGDVRENHLVLIRTMVRMIQSDCLPCVKEGKFTSDTKQDPVWTEWLMPNHFQSTQADRFWEAFNTRYYRNEVIS